MLDFIQIRSKYEVSVKTSSPFFLSVFFPATQKTSDGSANICEQAEKNSQKFIVENIGKKELQVCSVQNYIHCCFHKIEEYAFEKSLLEISRRNKKGNSIGYISLIYLYFLIDKLDLHQKP